jgi:hypothetical protein
MEMMERSFVSRLNHIFRLPGSCPNVQLIFLYVEVAFVQRSKLSPRTTQSYHPLPEVILCLHFALRVLDPKQVSPNMLTPQEVYMHAQATLLPGKRHPAPEGGTTCYPCRVISHGFPDTGETLGGLLYVYPFI